MVVHVRKLLYDESWPPLPPIYQPPPSLLYKGTKHYHDFSPFLIPMFFALGVGFLLIAYFTIVKKYYLSSNNRTTPPNPDDNQDGFVDENHGPAIFHPVWLINTIGLEQSVIDSISVFKYKKNEGLVEDAVCSICIDDYDDDETLRLLPKCNHAFHVPCIDTWLRSHKNCPTCRAPIVSEQFMNTQANESDSNLHNLRPIEETSNESLGIFDEVGDRHMGCERGTRSDKFKELPNEKREREDILTKKLQYLGTKSCDFRVFSDMVGHREKFEERVRRSISMDPFSASRICRAMANIHEMEVEGSSSTQFVQPKHVSSAKSHKGMNVNSRISKMMKSSSLKFSFRKGPISMKRSYSSRTN